MHIEHFTPWSALIGGALIGLSASALLLTHGKIAGISGIVGTLLSRGADERGYRASFLVGLVGAGTLLALVRPSTFQRATVTPLWLVVVAGLLVGFGTRLGNGCTSGHGVCGISRLSARSLAATATFLAAGMFAVFVARALGVVR